MDFVSIIGVRRDGLRHRKEEIDFLVQGAADGSIPDYQLAAWLMAAYLNPLNEEETAWLTESMAHSGQRVDLSGLPRPWVDKHSTGGVGDKTTLILLPLLAACGLTLVKMSGRGLGVTGGTIDKLDSVPGFRVDLSPAEMKAQAQQIGLAITGQSPDLAPADKVLYAIRDVTGTTSSIPLLVSSILSKKLAGGAETIVLDVKCGSGAFMHNFEGATQLATALKQTAQRLGLRCRLAITDMDQPLGSAVGNALEVEEARKVLDPAHVMSASTRRLYDLCLELAALTLEACNEADSSAQGRTLAEAAVSDGRALRKAEAWFAAQGADLHAELPKAPVQRVAITDTAGWVRRLDAETVGRAVIALGGGRQRKGEAIDPSVGVELHTCVGKRVEVGDPLFTLHAANEEAGEAAEVRIRNAFEILPQEVAPTPLILSIL